MRYSWKRTGVFVLAGTMLFGSSIAACAEELEEIEEPAGYHVYEVNENEATDTWYGVGRGDYLQAGIAKLLEGKPGYALGSGTTLSHFASDRLYVGIFLDESDTAKAGEWGTVDYWTKEDFDCSICMLQGDYYKAGKGKYYRVRGVHSATQDGITETTSTCTDALKF